MGIKIPSPNKPAIPTGGAPKIPMSRPSTPAPLPAPVKRTTYRTEGWDGSKTGEKIIIVAKSGMGKTTLASLAPKPAFIGLDEGGRKLHNPITGDLLQHIVDDTGGPPSTFLELRQALAQVPGMDSESFVLDTITVGETIAEQQVLATVKTETDKVAVNMESYGWGKGYRHLYDQMRLLLTDFDRIISAGKNVILIAQEAPIETTNTEGANFYCEHPRLYPGGKKAQWSVMNLYEEWADHILRISFASVNAAEKTRKAVADTTRVIHTRPSIGFTAKTRGNRLEPVITFNDQTDDSVWQFMFGGK
jgi:hypothetical protein